MIYSLCIMQLLLHHRGDEYYDNFDEEELFMLQKREEHHSFRSLLSLYSRRARSGHMRREALLGAYTSPFVRLFKSGHDDALITLCGFCQSSFKKLLYIYLPLFETYTPYPDDGLIHRRRRRRRKRSTEKTI